MILTIFVQGQDISYKQYTTEDGLPSDGVYDVARDSLGYLWFSTTLGLSRFDGERFVNFDAKNGLAETENFVFFKEGNKRLWVVGPNCLISYVENGNVGSYKHNGIIQKQLKGNPLPASVWREKNGNLHFSATSTGEIVIKENGELGNGKKILPTKKGNLKGLYFEETGQDYFARISPKNHKKESSFFKDSVEVNFSGFNYSFRDPSYLLSTDGLILNDDSALLQANSNSVFLISGGKMEKLVELSHRIIRLKEFGGKIYASTFGGLFEFSFGKQGILQMEFYLKDYIVTSCFVDENQGLWVCTHNSGVFFFPNRKIRVLNRKNRLLFDNIKTFYIDEEKTLFSAGFSGNVAIYPANAQAIDLSPLVPNSQNFRDIIPVSKNRLIFTSGRNFVWQYGIGKMEKVFPTIYNSKLKTFWNGVHSNDTVFLAGSDGLHMFIDGELTRLNTEVLEKPWNICVERFTSDHFLLGTKKGVLNFFLSRRSYENRFKTGPLSYLRIDNIKIMENGLIAYGTRGHGIFLEHYDSLINISQNQGLSGDYINAIYPHKNKLFVGTNSGLSIIEFASIDPYEYSVYKYNINDGLSGNNIQDIQIVDSLLYLATSKGISVVESFMDDEKPAKLVLENLFVNGTKVSLEECRLLTYDQNNLEFDIAGISFFSRGDIKYHYMLDGVDEEWRTSRGKEITYNNLPPGEYQFLLKSENSKGVLSAEPLTWEFEITPPFWKTWWFIVSGIMAILILAYLIFRYQMELYRRKSILEESIEKEKAQLELQALRSQMNPHFLFNSLNSIQYFFSTSDNKKARGYLASFANLMRNILDSSSKTEVLLKEEIESLRLYLRLEQMRFSENLEYEIKLDGLQADEKIFIPPMVVQPFIENAIIHGLERGGRDGKILVKFFTERGNLICHVEDNGIGREAAQKKVLKKSHKSVGMLLSRRRMEILNRDSISGGEIKVTDLVNPEGRAIGTRVSIYFGNISKLLRI